MIEIPPMTREKRILVIAIGILFLMIIWQATIKPMSRRLTNEARLATEKTKTLKQLQAMSSDIQILRSGINEMHKTIASQPNQGRLLSLLEHASKSSGLSDHVASMQPKAVAISEDYQEISTEIKIENTSLTLVLDLLSKLDELGLAIGIKSLELKQSSDNVVNATIVVSTLNQKGRA